jgi:integrase
VHPRIRHKSQKYLVRIQHDLLTGAYVDLAKGRTTVEDYYAVWEARQPWRAATRTAVRSSFRGHVVPAFGKRPLGSVRRGDIESWAAGLSLSASSAGLAVQHLGTMFESAVADGLIATNPVRRAKRPRVDVEPVVPFSSEQRAALDAASPGWFRVALTLGAACGLRQGEATGLTLDRIDFLRRQLTVDRQLVSPPSGPPVFAPPKTPRSYRSVPLADVALEALSAHIDENGTGQYGVLLHRKGRPLTRPRFGEIWREIRTQAAMPAARYHDTRHTYASILLSGGVSVAAAADEKARVVVAELMEPHALSHAGRLHRGSPDLAEASVLDGPAVRHREQKAAVVLRERCEVLGERHGHELGQRDCAHARGRLRRRDERLAGRERHELLTNRHRPA